jgi:hypothetical protein
LAPNAAGRDVRLSRDLADVMPCVADGMANGDVSAEQAQVLAQLRKDLKDEAVRSADPHLADAALRQDPVALRAFVTAVRHSYARDKVERDEKRAYDERRLHASSTIYGTGVGNWTCDPVSQEIIMAAIHAASKPIPGDDRSAAQRRLDGLLTICELAMRSGELPETGGVKPHVTVVAQLDTLEPKDGAPTATLGFGGAVSGGSLWRIACDANIARVVMGPKSEVINVGRSSRFFTTAQRRAIVARDRHCRWPGCDRPASWCDGHHGLDWLEGGETSVDNGVLLCGRHHDRVHHDDLAVVVTADGSRSIDIRPGSGSRAKRRSRQRAGP